MGLFDRQEREARDSVRPLAFQAAGRLEGADFFALDIDAIPVRADRGLEVRRGERQPQDPTRRLVR